MPRRDGRKRFFGVGRRRRKQKGHAREARRAKATNHQGDK